MTEDEAVEAIRVASFEAPKAHSHTEWARRITAVLVEYRQTDAARIAQLEESHQRAIDRLWHGRWMRAHDHDECADDDECALGYDSWMALQ